MSRLTALVFLTSAVPLALAWAIADLARFNGGESQLPAWSLGLVAGYLAFAAVNVWRRW